ncbi:unnamed protein product [Oncorhynchus mykiss]|uniref:ADP/ATP translocase n=1 Tax=Oncorhynchus mykiss TaxID=8022 RepID=A0A060X4U8_ONCMY|nr:unnamed protein product [Oncorhynchus mykiss]
MAHTVQDHQRALPQAAVSPSSHAKRLPVLDTLLCGVFAGAVAKTVIAPLHRTKIIFLVSSQNSLLRKPSDSYIVRT